MNNQDMPEELHCFNIEMDSEGDVDYRMSIFPSQGDTTYVRKDLTDRRDAVDELIKTYGRIIGSGRYPSIDRDITALLEARGNE